MYASRNLRLCTKDCLCLFVCPTGATNTEDGQIDRAKCVEGCRACVDACPSHAIHLVMEHYPLPAEKTTAVAAKTMEMCIRKLDQEAIAKALGSDETRPALARLARALAYSCRILAEDCARESGYLIPQCPPTQALLERVLNETDGEMRASARELLDLTL